MAVRFKGTVDCAGGVPSGCRLAGYVSITDEGQIAVAFEQSFVGYVDEEAIADIAEAVRLTLLNLKGISK